MTQLERRTKDAQRVATMQTLLGIGREVFATEGYAGASMEDIVRRAGLTRGALYHHFSGKEGLFRAVLEDVQRDVAQRVAAAADAAPTEWEQVLAGCRAFLAASLDSHVQQIMLVDAPAVLGWEAWRQLDAEYSMKLLEEGLRALIDTGSIVELPVVALTHLLSGAMNEAALWIARSENTALALDEATHTLETLLISLRREGSKGQ